MKCRSLLPVLVGAYVTAFLCITATRNIVFLEIYPCTW